MAKVTIDADKLLVEADNIKKIAKEYNDLLNEMYQKINNISNNGVWSSSSEKGAANVFINNVLKSKNQTMALGTNLNSLGDKIILLAKNVNNSASDKL